MPYSVRQNEYLTTAQASKYLNVTRFTVLNWIKSGKLQSASTFGGHSRIPRGVLKAALKQISTTNRMTTPPSKPQETSTIVRCWESKEIVACGGHDCHKCLIFKKKLNHCFLSVESYGSLSRKYAHECIDCAFLAKHHPHEKKILQRQNAKVQSQTKEASTVGVNGILKKVFYNSGRLMAKIGQLSAPAEPKRRYKRANRSSRKG